MRTFVTDLAAKSSPPDHLSAFKHWLFVRRDVLRYALAPCAVALAFLARLALTPILGDASPYLLFVPAVLTAAGLGGLGPGLLATGLSVVLGLFVITTFPSLSVPEIVEAALFTLIAAASAGAGSSCNATVFKPPPARGTLLRARLISRRSWRPCRMR